MNLGLLQQLFPLLNGKVHPGLSLFFSPQQDTVLLSFLNLLSTLTPPRLRRARPPPRVR